MEHAYRILQSLGALPCYLGTRQTAMALALILEDPTRLEAVVDEVYRPIASQTGSHWKSVARNIRTVVDRAWNTNPELIAAMAGFPLTYPPKPAEFLAILASYLERGGSSR